MAETKLGGPVYVGATPASEQIPENDSTINDNQVIGNAVLAGPITIEAIVTVTGNVVIM
jgi:hypothetical protein|tara:strand:+ start:427 stop:603 length:177 start_codon:yes stop_codon:yes gene_type:complete